MAEGELKAATVEELKARAWAVASQDGDLRAAVQALQLLTKPHSEFSDKHENVGAWGADRDAVMAEIAGTSEVIGHVLRHALERLGHDMNTPEVEDEAERAAHAWLRLLADGGRVRHGLSACCDDVEAHREALKSGERQHLEAAFDSMTLRRTRSLDGKSEGLKGQVLRLPTSPPPSSNGKHAS